MPNTSRKSSADQNMNSYLNAQANWRSNRGDIMLLMKRLKKNNQKKDKEKLIFLLTTISMFVVCGIIISF